MELYLGFFALLLCPCFVNGQSLCWDNTWYNDSLTLQNGSSYEQPSAKVLNQICPDGSKVIFAQCKDDKEEPFKNTKNATGNHFLATCDHVNGLICEPYKGYPNATCPDFAIQYACKCTSTKLSGGTVTPQNVRVSTTVTTSLSERTTKTVDVTKNPASIALTTSFGASTITKIGTGSSSTDNGGNGSISATSARRHHCKNSASRFKSVVLLLALSTFVYRFVQ